MKRLVVILLFALAACAPRGMLELAPSVVSGSLHDIWVANFRPTEPPAGGQRSRPRPSEVAYQKIVVSVPATHRSGNVEWPKGPPDAATDFVTTSAKAFSNSAEFAARVTASNTSGDDEILLFVHGYNVTNGEAVYQLAQIKHDFEVPTPTVLFSWPSAAKAAGYLYDRDSILIARDRLEEVIVALTRKRGRTVSIVGHSMGSLLIMETLRQIEISGSVDVEKKISGLFLMAPDIDGELFQAQAARLDVLPAPFVIVVANQDRALRVSALLTGRTNRLGSQTDRSAVGTLPITVVDVSELSTGGLDHSIALTSPTAIAIFKNSGTRSKSLILVLDPSLRFLI